MRRLSALPATLLAALILVSCSGTAKTQQDSTADTRGTDDEKVLQQDPLERNYDPHVIMKRAESFFEKEDYPEAAVEYQHFLELHKAHVLAPYAQYRLGLSYHKQITTRDRDPVPVRQAMEAMEKLLKDYPGSAYESDARSRIKECRDHLASYELYVGKHYYRQNAYLAAMHRFEGVIAQYRDSDAVPEASYYLALTYNDMGAKDRAVDQLVQLVKQFPKNKITPKGQALLAQLSKTSLKDIVAATTPASAKRQIPPPLPNGHVSLVPTPALLPVGPADAGPPIITCRLNVSC